MILQGDCLQVLPTLDDNSVDAIVTDPPYELGFMNKGWDSSGIAYNVELWRECLRVLKPGGHLLSFGGSRTYHRMACAIEDAGFEIRDQIQWIYGSGFPKSQNIGKAIDNAAGVEREDLGKHPNARETLGSINICKKNGSGRLTRGFSEWEGWGSALKPAHEPIVLARKPLSEKTIAANVLKWGTGGINIDGCRVSLNGDKPRQGNSEESQTNTYGWAKGGIHKSGTMPEQGRFPANLIHDGSDEVVQGFPQTGPSKWGKDTGKGKDWHGIKGFGNQGDSDKYGNDSGSAARFFYCAKASKAERNCGLDSYLTVKYNIAKEAILCKDGITELVELLKKATSELTVKWNIGECGASITGQCHKDSLSTILTAISKITPSEILNLLTHSLTKESTAGANCETVNGGSPAENAVKSNLLQPNTTNGKAELALGVENVVSEMLLKISGKENWQEMRNIHSTVKPLALMRYLCRLITPPDGTVLDPFAGSGSTLIAAKQEGFDFIGIEMEEEYIEIIKCRLQSVEEEKKQLTIF